MGKPLKVKDTNNKTLTINVTEKVKEGILLNHLAYRLGDVINTYMIDAVCIFDSHGCTLKHEEKQKFLRMVEASRRLKLATKDFTKAMYECEIADRCCEGSDYLADIIKLIYDRVGEDNTLQQQVRATIFNSFKPHMNFYK